MLAAGVQLLLQLCAPQSHPLACLAC
jgi:hypothetical protein